MSLETISRTIIDEIQQGEIESRQEIEARKKQLCSEHSFDGMPKNSDIIQFLDGDEKEAKQLLKTKPMRTISGIANIAIMARPAPCGGGCIYCPKGENAPQSYTGKEPATRRAIRNQYQPLEQVHDRLSQYEKNGHSIDKSKLIVMGGTFPFQDPEYQRKFIREAYNGFNTYGSDPETDSLEEAKEINENADVRCVGMTFETRPDICETSHIDRILEFGGTRVEMGVQTVFDETHELTNRGHGMDRVIEATRRLKNAGFKVCYHLMLGLPGETREDDIEKFNQVFSREEFQPDEVKVYPCEVIQGTELYRRYEEGDFEPISDEEAKERLKRIQKDIVPPHVRIKRVMRDIPSTEVDAGPQLTNMRQMALQELEKEGERCRCIRCREVGHVRQKHGRKPENPGFVERVYDASGGKEFFIGYEDRGKDIILGFLRLRAPEQSFRPEIDGDTVIVRQLKVLGTSTALGEEGEVQHQGLGKKLMQRAEEKAEELGRGRIAVISGVGVREYYRKLGYGQEGVYMVKELD